MSSDLGETYPFLFFDLSLNVRVHGNTSYGNARANSSLCGNSVACSMQVSSVS
jgi:hypothetical protein